MNTLLTLTKSSIKMFVRNRQALFFTLFTPLIIMTIFGVIGFDKPPTFDVGLVATSPTPQTQQFLDQLKSFPTLKIHQDTKDAELKALNDGDRAAVLEVPNDFLNVAPGTPPKTI